MVTGQGLVLEGKEEINEGALSSPGPRSTYSGLHPVCASLPFPIVEAVSRGLGIVGGV
jgi:hypothetical protein